MAPFRGRATARAAGTTDAPGRRAERRRLSCSRVRKGQEDSRRVEEVAIGVFRTRSRTKVLLCTDGSPASDRAARMAIELSNKLGFALHVVCVEPVDAYGLPEHAVYAPDTQGYLREPFERLARERLDEEAAKIREAGGEIAEAHAGFGRPDAEIVRLAEELNAGLVVLGSQGFGALRRAVMGSVSLSVVRHAHCPVLVVRGEGTEETLPDRILLAIDGSAEAYAASQTAAKLSDHIGSELHLVYVLPMDALPFPLYYARDRYEADLERARQEARAFFDEQAKLIEDEGGAVAGVHLETGRPDHEIVRLSEELGAGLVILGSRGLGGVKRALLGSVSDSVVRHAHGSVLVVRGEARD